MRVYYIEKLIQISIGFVVIFLLLKAERLCKQIRTVERSIKLVGCDVYLLVDLPKNKTDDPQGNDTAEFALDSTTVSSEFVPDSTTVTPVNTIIKLASDSPTVSTVNTIVKSANDSPTVTAVNTIVKITPDSPTVSSVNTIVKSASDSPTVTSVNTIVKITPDLPTVTPVNTVFKIASVSPTSNPGHTEVEMIGQLSDDDLELEEIPGINTKVDEKTLKSADTAPPVIHKEKPSATVIQENEKPTEVKEKTEMLAANKYTLITSTEELIPRNNRLQKRESEIAEPIESDNNSTDTTNETLGQQALEKENSHFIAIHLSEHNISKALRKAWLGEDSNEPIELDTKSCINIEISDITGFGHPYLTKKVGLRVPIIFILISLVGLFVKCAMVFTSFNTPKTLSVMVHSLFHCMLWGVSGLFLTLRRYNWDEDWSNTSNFSSPIYPTEWFTAEVLCYTMIFVFVLETFYHRFLQYRIYIEESAGSYSIVEPARNFQCSLYRNTVEELGSMM